MDTLTKAIEKALKIEALRAQICAYETTIAQCKINIIDCQKRLGALFDNKPKENKSSEAA